MELFRKFKKRNDFEESCTSFIECEKFNEPPNDAVMKNVEIRFEIKVDDEVIISHSLNYQNLEEYSTKEQILAKTVLNEMYKLKIENELSQKNWDSLITRPFYKRMWVKCD